MIRRLLTSAADYSHGLLLAATQGRSPKWPAVRRKWLAEHPACDACGRTDFVAVHHKMPFHIDPSKELDPSNLKTLCENDPDGRDDHFHVGHLGDWKTFNPRVDEDAAQLLLERQS